MTEALQRVLRASEPLTLASVPPGFLPWLAADLARAAHGSNRAAGRSSLPRTRRRCAALADTVPVFAPEVEVLTLPGLGLPALRPGVAGAAGDGREAGDAQPPPGEERQAPAAGRHRQRRHSAAADAVPGPPAHAADRAKASGSTARRLIAQLNALGFQRSDTVAEHGEYAVRGSLIDLFPPGEEQALRLDFFGDEIDSLRRFDPADQRSTDKADGLHAAAGLGSPARRGQHQALPRRATARQFGATATGDPLYQACREGRRMAGHGALAAAARGAAFDAVRSPWRR